jgi:hypothetical protein
MFFLACCDPLDRINLGLSVAFGIKTSFSGLPNRYKIIYHAFFSTDAA